MTKDNTPPHKSKPSQEALEAIGAIKESDRSDSILPSSLHPQHARASHLGLRDQSARIQFSIKGGKTVARCLEPGFSPERETGDDWNSEFSGLS
jgi:hypothetical protein